MAPNQCYKCHKLMSYPYFKMPLGPIDVKEVSKEEGIEFRKGLVLYAWFCLPCGQQYIAGLTEEFLSKALEE